MVAEHTANKNCCHVVKMKEMNYNKYFEHKQNFEISNIKVGGKIPIYTAA